MMQVAHLSIVIINSSSDFIESTVAPLHEELVSIDFQSDRESAEYDELNQHLHTHNKEKKKKVKMMPEVNERTHQACTWPAVDLSKSYALFPSAVH